MRQSPCYNDGKGCELRTVEPNCHDTCEMYLAWVADLAAENDERRKPGEADAHTKQTIARNCKRAGLKKRVGQQ